MVAIIDDDAAVCDSLAALLTTAGWSTLSFTAPLEALASVHIGKANCLLVDLQMPVLDGFELVRRLRGSGVAPPVIFMTAHDVRGLEASARRAGGAALLQKPFDPEALLASIRTLLDGGG
jgi:two-component system, LuxR family, response regulator FixJ